MAEQGYIKLHRSILEWEWWDDEITRTVFLWLLLNANWEDSRFMGYNIPKGSLVTSWESLAKNCKISPQNGRTAIKHLKSTGEITTTSTNKFTIVSIVNWEKYQCQETEANKQLTSKLTFNQHSTNNIKEYKEYKNIKNDIAKPKFNANKGMFPDNYDWDAINREIGYTK